MQFRVSKILDLLVLYSLDLRLFKLFKLSKCPQIHCKGFESDMPENQNLSSLSCGKVEGVSENHQRLGRKGLFPQSQLQQLQEILMEDFETQWESNKSIQFTAPELR